MKQIILVSHAKAEKAKKDLEDLNRTLKKKGKKEATEMAAKMKEAGVLPDLILTSPAERASQTARLFAGKLKFDPAKIVETKELYTATSVESFLKLIKGLEPQRNTVMLVGHEPTLSDLASQLVPDFNSQMPSPGVIVIEFKKNSWKQITRRSGVIKAVQFPLNKTQRNHLDQAVYKTLKENIRKNLLALFDELNHPPSKKLNKLIKKQSKKLASAFLTSEKNRTIQMEAEINAALTELKSKEVAKSTPEKKTEAPLTADAPAGTPKKKSPKKTKSAKKPAPKTQSTKPTAKPDAAQPEPIQVQAK